MMFGKSMRLELRLAGWAGAASEWQSGELKRSKLPIFLHVFRDSSEEEDMEKVRRTALT